MKKKVLFLILLFMSKSVFAQFPNLVASSNSPVCQGNTLSLSASHDALSGGTTAAYNWADPNNFTSTVQNLQRLGANAVDGTYTVTLTLTGTQTGTYTGWGGTRLPERLQIYITDAERFAVAVTYKCSIGFRPTAAYRTETKQAARAVQ